MLFTLLLVLAFALQGQNSMIERKRDSISIIRSQIDSTRKIIDLDKKNMELYKITDKYQKYDSLGMIYEKRKRDYNNKKKSLNDLKAQIKNDSASLASAVLECKELNEKLSGMIVNQDSIELSLEVSDYLSSKPYDSSKVSGLLDQTFLADDKRLLLEGYCCKTNEAFIIYKIIAGYRNHEDGVAKYENSGIEKRFSEYPFILIQFESKKASLDNGQVKYDNPFEYHTSCQQKCQN